MTIDGRSVRGDATRDLVLDTALVMFAEQGYRATSVRDIAARCGMTHPGLLYHFPSKAGLLMAVLQRRDELDCNDPEVAIQFEDLDGLSLLAHLVEGARDNASKRGIVELFANLSVEAAMPEHPAHAYFVDRYLVLRGTITRAFADLESEGLLRDGVVPGIAAAHIVACMDGLQIQWLLDPESIDMAAALESIVNGLLREPLDLNRPPSRRRAL